MNLRIPLAIVLLAAARASAQDVMTCADLRVKARELRNGASNCDAAVAAGTMRTCQVEVPFALSGVRPLAGLVPSGSDWRTPPVKAREIAAKLEALRCVERLAVTTEPPGPLKPGDSFTVVAKVVMADGADPSGVELTVRPEGTGLISISKSTGFARKFGGPIRGGPEDVFETGTDGVARIPGLVALRGNPVVTLAGQAIIASILLLHDVWFPEESARVVVPIVEDADCSLKPGEDIRNRFVDDTMLAPGYLPLHENGPARGHTMTEHVGKKHEYLVSRLQKSRKRPIDLASTYTDQKTAEDVIRSIVNSHISEITAWFSNTVEPRTGKLLYSGESVIGFGIAPDDLQKEIPLKNARAILSIDGKARCAIRIFTSFPEAEKNEK